MTQHSEKAPPELVEMVEFSEAQAFADMFVANPEDQGQRVERIAGAYALLAPSMPITLFNRVLGLGLLEPIDESVLRRIVDAYRSAGVKQWSIECAPQALDERVEKLLTAYGFVRTGYAEKMYRAAADDIHIKTDLTVKRIGSDCADDFADVCVTAFGLHPSLKTGLTALFDRPGWQHFIAFDGAMPVACGSLFVNHNIGWLGMGGTLPSHRRRGAQGEIMAMRVRAAARAGCTWIVTETSADSPEHPNPSFHNMLRTGFRQAYQRPEFTFDPRA